MSPTVPCILCATPSKLRLERPTGYDPQRIYRIFHCEKCCFGFIHPRPTPTELAPYYREYHNRPPRVASPPAASKIASLDQRFRTRLAWAIDYSRPMLLDVIRVMHESPGSVCDVGCGDGTLLQKIQESGIPCEGIEPSPDAIEVAARRGLKIHQGTAEEVPPSASKAHSLVIMSHVLEHVLNPDLAIANCTSLLQPGGKVLMEVPNNDSLSAKQAGPAWRWLDVPRHINFFNRQSLDFLLRRHGYEIIRFQYTGFTRMFRDEWIMSEQAEYDQLARRDSHLVSRVTRNSSSRAWQLLIRSFFANKDRKYDSIRVEARRR